MAIASIIAFLRTGSTNIAGQARRARTTTS
jgi:hypothetical protein